MMRAAVGLLLLLVQACWSLRRRPWAARSFLPRRGGATEEEFGDGDVEWHVLRSFARDASLVYYDAAVIIAAHERGRYGRSSPNDVNWASNSSAVAVWHRTRHGDAALIVRPRGTLVVGPSSCGESSSLFRHRRVRKKHHTRRRYFVRTERLNGRYSQRVVIKGSDNVQNFRDDVDYPKVGCAICHARFHRGFLRVANAIWDDIEALLRRDATVELTGHSLGGGAATILAMRLAALGYDVARVISFGAPKVTNAHGCRLFATRVPLLRVLTADDPIPMLPSFDAMTHNFGFYRHFGRRVVLLDDDDDFFHKDKDDDDDGDLSDEDADLDDDEEDDDDGTTPRVVAKTDMKAEFRRQRQEEGDVVDVELCPIDGTGEVRKKRTIVGRGRFAARPDACVLRLRAKPFIPTWRSMRTAVRDFALHQLDENFLLHAHHVSPFAHSMDAYETQIATRELRATSVPPHMCRRRERPMAAVKRRLPFLGPYGGWRMTVLHCQRYDRPRRRRVKICLEVAQAVRVTVVSVDPSATPFARLGIARPKYILMSLLFVGWTGGWHAISNKQPPRFDGGDDDGEDR